MVRHLSAPVRGHVRGRLGDTVSRRTKLELLPFVKDAEAEERRMEEEKGA